MFLASSNISRHLLMIRGLIVINLFVGLAALSTSTILTSLEKKVGIAYQNMDTHANPFQNLFLEVESDDDDSDESDVSLLPCLDLAAIGSTSLPKQAHPNYLSAIPLSGNCLYLVHHQIII